MHYNKLPNPITSSERSRIEVGMTRFSAFAVCQFHDQLKASWALGR